MLRKNSFLFLFFLAGCVSQQVNLPTLSNFTISGLVVFSSYVTNNPYIEQIFLQNLETGDIKQLTYEGSNSLPKWSPDGSQIVFTRILHKDKVNIYIMEKDGSNQRPLIESSPSENMAVWSPDSKKIAFTSYASGKSEIYIVDLANKSTMKLTNSSQFASFPAWSSSGQKIAFQSSVGGGRSQVFVINSDGTNLEQITKHSVDNFDGIPIWCPDDSCIIFFRHERGFDKLMFVNLKNKEENSLLDGLFDPNSLIRDISQSALREYLTFKIDNEYYAMNFDTKEIFSLKINATSLSLYP